MANGLNQLGILVRKSGSSLIVEGKGGMLYAPKFPIPVGNAGTTLRFLAGLASLAKGSVTFEGHPRMSERSMSGLLNALTSLGVQSRDFGPASRYIITGGTLQGGKARVQADISSQFISSLLMVAPYAKEDVAIELTEKPVSASYLDLTVNIMRRFGVEAIREDDLRFSVKSGQRYIPSMFEVESDWSGAAYFLAAAAITGGDITVDGLQADSIQGDMRIVEILERMGWKNQERELKGIDIDLQSTPDLVPTVAILGLFAEGKTRILNVAHLRLKESNRLEGLACELRKLGASVTLLEDGLEIEPTKLHGAQLQTYDDHRLAMSFALIGLRVPGVRIENPECVRKSFPGFWAEFGKLYKRKERA